MGENVGQSMKVIAYDGTCILCNKSLQWILKRDSKSLFKYTQLQGDWVRNTTLPLDPTIDSIAFFENNKVYYKSTAALKIASNLPFPYNLLRVFHLVPTPIRDWIYDYIAKNRYRWFGHNDQCMMPPKDWKSRFLP